MLDTQGIARLAKIAAILLPGDDRSPAANAVAELDMLLRQAVEAIGSEEEPLREALALLPAELDWASVQEFAESLPDEFEIVATVAAGAYFMAPSVLASVGYPQGARKAARNEQVVDELETGVLDLVMERDSMVREVPR